MTAHIDRVRDFLKTQTTILDARQARLWYYAFAGFAVSAGLAVYFTSHPTNVPTASSARTLWAAGLGVGFALFASVFYPATRILTRGTLARGSAAEPPQNPLGFGLLNPYALSLVGFGGCLVLIEGAPSVSSTLAFGLMSALALFSVAADLGGRAGRALRYLSDGPRSVLGLAGLLLMLIVSVFLLGISGDQVLAVLSLVLLPPVFLAALELLRWAMFDETHELVCDLWRRSIADEDAEGLMEDYDTLLRERSEGPARSE